MSDVLFRIVIEDAGVNAALKTNREEVKKLNDELKKVNAGTKEYQELAEKLLKTKVETANLRDRQRELNKEFQATRVPTDSLAGLRLEYGKLTAQIAALSKAERESQFGKNLIKNAASVKKEIDGIEQSVGRFTGNVGNYSSALNSFVGFVKSSLGPLAALAAAQKILANNATISDRVADVAKAVDISVESVNRLADALENRLTRTSLLDQLGIAEIGGKLGVAEKDLFSFIEAVDVVNVALGDQFGGSVEQTTDVIGKLRNVLTDIKTDNIGKDIQNIGNALNFLEAQGAASAGVIADFAGRIAGAGRNLGVTSGQIIGVSSTLDELGVNAERGSSAYVRLLQRVAAAPGDFAKAADVSAKEFTDLVNNDIAGAVNLFLEKINSQELSNTELQKVLKALDLDGVGVVETVGKLGQNMDLLNRRTSEAGKALKETDSIQQEFEKKNQTLGAAVQNLTNAFINLTTDSGIANFLKGVIEAVTDLINLFRSENDVLGDQQKEFQALVGVIQDTTVSEQERAKAIEELKKQYPDYIRYVNDDKNGQIDLNATIDEGNKLFQARIFLQATQEKQANFVKQIIDSENELTEALKEQQRVRQSGTGGQRVGIVRNEAQDQNFNPLTQADLAQKRVDSLRETIKNAKDSLENLRASANETSLRVFNKSLDDLNGKVDEINLSGGEAAPDGTSTIGEGKGKIEKTKKDAEAAAGSISFLREQVSKLQKQLDNTPGDSKLLDSLILKLRQSEFALAELEARILGTGRPAVSEEQNILNELAGGAAPGELPDVARAQFDRIVERQAFEIDQEEEKQRKLDELDEIYDKRQRDRTKEAIEEEKRKRKEMYEEVKQTAFDVLGAVFTIASNKIDQERDKRVEAINKEYEQRIDNAAGNAVLIEQLEKEQAEKTAEIEKEAGERKKRNAKTEAIIQGAVAFVEALPNIFLAALVAVQTAAQIAVIDSQTFASGGELKRGKFGGKSHANGGTKGYFEDGTKVEVEAGERFFILNKRASADIKGLSDLNAKHGGRRFADGGSIDFIPQVFGQYAPVQTSVTASASFSREQTEMIGKIIADEIAKQVAPAVREGAALGTQDGRRMLERQNIAEQQRQI